MASQQLNVGPCNPDHNGECLICDAWLSDCAFERLLNRDFKYENLEELLVMFKDHLTEDQKERLRKGENVRDQFLS